MRLLRLARRQDPFLRVEIQSVTRSHKVEPEAYSATVAERAPDAQIVRLLEKVDDGRPLW